MAQRSAIMPDIDKRALRIHQHGVPLAAQGAKGAAATDSRPSVQVACASEISKWCQSDEEFAMDLLKANTATAEVQAALLTVNQCLASHTSVLSPACLSSLVVSYMEAPRGTGTYIHGGARERRGHRDGPRMPMSDDSEDARQPKQRDKIDDARERHNQEVDKFYQWNRHGFGRPDQGDNGRQVRTGDAGRGHPHHRHNDDELGYSTVAWLVVLPFFALGVVVAVKRAFSFYRQRQLVIGRHNPDARDYEPLKQRVSERHHYDEED